MWEPVEPHGSEDNESEMYASPTSGHVQAQKCRWGEHVPLKLKLKLASKSNPKPDSPSLEVLVQTEEDVHRQRQKSC